MPDRTVLAAIASAGTIALALAGAAVSAPSDVSISLSASGSFQPGRELELDFESTGRITQLDVSVGQRVSRGQALGRVDDTGARRDVRTAESTLAAAQTRLRELLERRDFPVTTQQRRENEAAMEREHAAIKAARQALVDAKASAARDIAGLELTLSQAKAAQAAVAELDGRLRELEAKSADSDRAVAEARSSVTTAKAELAEAKVRRLALQKELEDVQHAMTKANALLARHQDELQDALAEGDEKRAEEMRSQIARDRDDLAALQARASVVAKGLLDASDAIERLQEKVSDASTALNEAASELAGFRSKLESARSEATAKSASAAETVANARQNLAAGQVRARQSVHAAESNLRSALASVQATVVGNDGKSTPPSETDLASAREAVESAEAALDKARQALANTVLRARADGVVAAVNATVGQTAGSGGGSGGGDEASGATGAGSGGAITLLADGLEVEALFGEVDAVQLRRGQSATVEINALGGVSVRGRVVSVAETATSVDDKPMYAVRVSLESTPRGIRAGMTARVEVQARL